MLQVGQPHRTVRQPLQISKVQSPSLGPGTEPHALDLYECLWRDASGEAHQVLLRAPGEGGETDIDRVDVSSEHQGGEERNECDCGDRRWHPPSRAGILKSVGKDEDDTIEGSEDAHESGEAYCNGGDCAGVENVEYFRVGVFWISQRRCCDCIVEEAYSEGSAEGDEYSVAVWKSDLIGVDDIWKVSVEAGSRWSSGIGMAYRNAVDMHASIVDVLATRTSHFCRARRRQRWFVICSRPREFDLRPTSSSTPALSKATHHILATPNNNRNHGSGAGERDHS